MEEAREIGDTGSWGRRPRARSAHRRGRWSSSRSRPGGCRSPTFASHQSDGSAERKEYWSELLAVSGGLLLLRTARIGMHGRAVEKK